MEIRRALHYIALLLLPGLAPTHTHATGRTRASGQHIALAADSTPYLLAVGAPPLRFREAAPPSEFIQRPAAGAPPIPGAEAIDSLPPTNRPDVILPQLPVVPTAAAEEVKNTAQPANQPSPPPATILPDDTTPPVRAEDFLPFFQPPGSVRAPSGVNVIMPLPAAPSAPRSIPASSATYTQTPR